MIVGNSGRQTKNLHSPSGKLVFTAYKGGKIVYSARHIPEYSSGFSAWATGGYGSMYVYGEASINQKESVPFSVKYVLHCYASGYGNAVYPNFTIVFNPGETGVKKTGYNIWGPSIIAGVDNYYIMSIDVILED